jgi:glycosyltransferase involved in cell wall biosynthesis
MKLGRRSVTSYAACSGYVHAEAVAAYGLPPSSVTTILNGIDIDRFLEIRGRRSDRDGGPFTFGMVGSLETHKDQAILIRALQVIRSTGVDARLVLIGSGRNEPVLRALTSELALDHAVIFRGAVSDVAPELIALDVFAYSVTDQEGLGIALVEALAAGLPAVASDVGACREVLNGGRLGRLVDGSDPQDWARELLDARTRTPAPVDSLARFDIGQTSRAYDQLLGY